MEKVTMSDGSTLEFSDKAKVQKLSRVDETGIHVIFGFRNGTLKTYTMKDDDPLIWNSAMHGLNQKFGDAFAGEASVDDCVLIFEKVADNLTQGKWVTTREGDGMSGTSDIIKALVAVTGKSVEDVKAKLATLDKDQKAALRVQPAIAAKIAEIKAAKPAKKVNADGEAVLAAFSAD